MRYVHCACNNVAFHIVQAKIENQCHIRDRSQDVISGTLTGICGPSTVIVAPLEVVPNAIKRSGEGESQLGLDGGCDGSPHIVTTSSRGNVDGYGDVDDAGSFDMRSNLTVLVECAVVVAGSECPVGAVLDLGLEVDQISAPAKDLVGHDRRRVGMGQTIHVDHPDGEDFTVASMGQKGAAVVAAVAILLGARRLVIREGDGAVVGQVGTGDVELGLAKDDLAAFDEVIEAGPLLLGQAKSLPGLASIVGIGALVVKVPAGDGLAWNFQGGDALDDAAIALGHWSVLTLVLPLALALEFAGCSRAKVGLLQRS